MAKGAPTPASFKPGQSGNPNGRPKREWTVQGMIEEAMEEIDENEKLPAKKIVYRKIVQMAKRGDMLAVKEINSRLDGMSKQYTDLTTNGKDLPTPILGGVSRDTVDEKE